MQQQALTTTTNKKILGQRNKLHIVNTLLMNIHSISITINLESKRCYRGRYWRRDRNCRINWVILRRAEKDRGGLAMMS